MSVYCWLSSERPESEMHTLWQDGIDSYDTGISENVMGAHRVYLHQVEVSDHGRVDYGLYFEVVVRPDDHLLGLARVVYPHESLEHVVCSYLYLSSCSIYLDRRLEDVSFADLHDVREERVHNRSVFVAANRLTLQGGFLGLHCGVSII